MNDSLRSTQDGNALNILAESASKGELVVIIGTGVSISLTNGKVPDLSWKGLIENGFSYSLMKGRITGFQHNNWKVQLNSDDLDDLLSAADFMIRKLGGPSNDLYARWLESVFADVAPINQEMKHALSLIHACGVPIATLNYDHLLERTLNLSAITIDNQSNVTAWMRNENKSIFHLHGSWDVPSTCILGVRDYETTLGNEVRDLIQRSLCSFKRLLFIGCGNTFSDPNFSALIKWLRGHMKGTNPQHYALVRDDEMADRHSDPNWHGFVEPISYGSSHNDLPIFIKSVFSSNSKEDLNSLAKINEEEDQNQYKETIKRYREFLIKECGQMAIEGVSADFDTAQRRFDLERLFVPIEVIPCQPEYPATDPNRNQKILEWKEKNNTPVSFSKIFEQNSKIALLALPGGGKTILLKRLAVAYADQSRLHSSVDHLPSIDVLPVLIRCREWRDFIRRPILTLLRYSADITGDSALSNLSDAVLPYLKSGKVLLLVDGLDEIHNDGDRACFVENLESFLRTYPRIRLVVTSREAGFNLVAPNISRFCDRWQVAPLTNVAIISLCNHWHRLMTGASPDALAESDEVAQYILHNDSLRRLAENPLLLTMLLVVKNGAGRLPPDRVSLYERAVEVLLDTWNIKGHEPLNKKEAVPQLAYVAFELLRQGKQTATEKELLFLLEEARDKIPQIRRYAKEAPYDFLKRVELRSSLLVESGYQLEGARTVAFYQFRHLTFQEYLAAYAAVEGNYRDYQLNDTILVPLEPYVTAVEWKEVIPMAAVLAKKRAEPLIKSLVEEGLRNLQERGFKGIKSNIIVDYPEGIDLPPFSLTLPPFLSRLVQCLAEEAEASPELLHSALNIISLLSCGCQSNDNWDALARGPYGEDLLHHVWKIYCTMTWPRESWIHNSFGTLSAKRYPLAFWISPKGQDEWIRLLRSNEREENARGLMVGVGLLWGTAHNIPKDKFPLKDFERYLFNDDPVLLLPSAWTWGLALFKNLFHRTSVRTFNRLVTVWVNGVAKPQQEFAAFALYTTHIHPRKSWKLTLSHEQSEWIRSAFNEEKFFIAQENLRSGYNVELSRYTLISCLKVAYYYRSVWSDSELIEHLRGLREYADEQGGGKDFDKMIKNISKNL